MRKFIICGTQRTGTTLIRSSLNSHPSIFCGGECFLIPPFYHHRKAYMGEEGFQAYMINHNISKLKLFIQKNKLTTQYLDYFYINEELHSKGFKLMLDQAKRFPQIIKYIIDQNISTIHVVRNNSLKVHVSMQRAQTTQQFHSKKSIQKIVLVELNTKLLLSQLHKIDSDNKSWNYILQGKVPYMEVSYEDFVQNKSDQSNRMLDFLGVQKCKLSSSLKKITSDDLRGVISNYEDVKNTLKGTKFEWMIS